MRFILISIDLLRKLFDKKKVYNMTFICGKFLKREFQVFHLFAIKDNLHPRVFNIICLFRFSNCRSNDNKSIEIKKICI